MCSVKRVLSCVPPEGCCVLWCIKHNTLLVVHNITPSWWYITQHPLDVKKQQHLSSGTQNHPRRDLCYVALVVRCVSFRQKGVVLCTILNERLDLNETVQVYKIQNQLPCPNVVVFSSRRTAHSRSTRNGNEIDTEFRRRQTGGKAFSVSGPKNVNSQPADVKNYTSASFFGKNAPI